MEFNEKVQQFFNQKGLTNREVANLMEYPEQLVSRHMHAKNVSMTWVQRLISVFPEIDLNYLLKEENLKTEEEPEEYNKRGEVLIEEIENNIKELKAILSRK